MAQACYEPRGLVSRGLNPERITLLNSLPAKSVLAETKLVLFGRYVLKFYIGIVQ
jgi:hypothetical protein